MSQPYYSYEELCHIVPILTADSTTPVSAEELNPLIERFLLKCRGSIQAIGGHSALLATPEGIAAKVSFKAGDQRLKDEQAVFSLLQKAPSPYIVRCFLSRPGITFMPFISATNLRDRIRLNSAPCPTLSWMFQLCSAAAALEALGLAHGDINPLNILVDYQDKLTLIDLDQTLPIGSVLDVGEEPYVRVHAAGENDGGGLYGRAGPETELFALGSIFWYMTRREELYAELDGFDRVNRLLKRQFPVLRSHDPMDDVICDCWLGKFRRVADLLHEIQAIATRQDTPDSILDIDLISSGEYLSKATLCDEYYSLLLEDADTQSLESGVARQMSIHEDSSSFSRWWERAIYSRHYLNGVLKRNGWHPVGYRNCHYC